MNDLQTAAQQALECLKGVARGKYDGNAAGVCAALEAALAQQAEPTPPDAAAGLVDDLCLLQLGWVSDAEGVLHRAAMGRVIARATEVRRLRKISQMEGNT